MGTDRVESVEVDGGGTGAPASAPSKVSSPEPVESAPQVAAPKVGWLRRQIQRYHRVALIVTLLWYFVWNLPGFINVISALKLRHTGRCRILAYSKGIYCYPLIPLYGALTGLYYLGVSPQYLGLVAVLAAAAVFFIAVESVRGASLVAAIAIFFALAMGIVAMVALKFDVVGGLVKSVAFFGPQFHVGTACLGMVLAALICLYSTIWAWVGAVFKVENNVYYVKQLDRSTPYAAEEWRLQAVIADWMEWGWMGAADLRLLTNFGGGAARRTVNAGISTGEDDRQDLILHNVPGGGWVEYLVMKAMSVLDVQPGHREEEP